MNWGYKKKGNGFNLPPPYGNFHTFVLNPSLSTCSVFQTLSTYSVLQTLNILMEIYYKYSSGQDSATSRI